MNFEKSKKGLGEEYEEEFKVNILGQTANPEVDAAQGEIDALFTSLYYELDQLSNYHFTPKPINKEATISTQNVDAFKIEEQVPVGKGFQADAKEFKLTQSELVNKEELDKVDKRKERL